MIYKYLPCQILGHDFDEKSEFLDYELSIKLPAITQVKNGRVQRRVGSRENVTSSNTISKQTYAEEECNGHVLSFVVCFLSTLALE